MPSLHYYNLPLVAPKNYLPIVQYYLFYTLHFVNDHPLNIVSIIGHRPYNPFNSFPRFVQL
jgi:hypothetical protein